MRPPIDARFAPYSSDPVPPWDQSYRVVRGNGVCPMLSLKRGLRADPKARGELFRTCDWDAEIGYTIRAKTGQFSWGLLKGKLEAP